jgi:hypothetical protein
VIAGTVEGAGRRLRVAARRVDGVAKEYNLGALVTIAQQSCPGVLGVAGDRVDEVDHPLFLRAGLDRLLGRADACRVAAAAEERQEVDTGDIAENECDQQPADAEGTDPHAGRASAHVFDVSAIACRPAHEVASSG